MLKTKNSQ